MFAFAKHKQVRLAVQIVIALALIAYLIGMIRHENVASAWDRIGPRTLLLACACFAGATILTVRRWQLLLRYQGVEENLLRLAEVYFIGLFCSLFLPTSAGGDAFRVYDLSRRGRPVARVLLATLQDRLIGLGAVMLVGLAALWFHDVLPDYLLATVMLVYAMGLFAVVAALIHGLVLDRLHQLAAGLRWPNYLKRIWAWKTVATVTEFLAPLRHAKDLTPRRIVRVAVLALASFLVAVAMHGVVCAALDASCDALALCVVVSLVGVVRMLAISPNGIGVGEGAFVFLMSLFGVASEKAALAALSLLGVQTMMSLVGGLLLLRRTLSGARMPASAVPLPPSPVLALRAATWNGEVSEVTQVNKYPPIGLADVPVALLAGGLATRLGSITAKTPKALVEVAGRPFIDHQLTLLQRHGVRRVVLCLGYLGDQVANHVENGARYGLDVKYSFDGDKLLGTGGAIRRALPMLGETFWVLYGDSYMDIDYRTVFRAFQRQPVLGLMTVLGNANQWDRSNVIFRNGKLICYDKRQTRPEMEYIDYGASLLRGAAVGRIPENTPYDLADLLHDLVENGEIVGYEVHTRFYEIGCPQGLAETTQYLQSHHSHSLTLANSGGLSRC